ncbi:MAG: putative DMT superfamily transporter inner membrane protein [Promethearchaeota archaeon]|nr:MAG: putative DMT superfamily transporter inner membrane protein [Candidatus Lokiarchaeota archaeon]
MSKNAKKSGVSNKKILGIILLVITTVLWGTTFIITKNVIENIPLFLYLGLRFSVALLGLSPYFFRLKRINKKTIVMGAVSGCIYFIAIATQTIGLTTTSAGKAGFITGLNTIMVPFLAYVLFKEAFKKRIYLAATLSIVGMAFLFLEGEGGIIIGDIWVLTCAFFCALFIIYNDKYVRLVDVYLYSIVQLFIISVCCFASSFILGESYNLLNVDFTLWMIIIYMGIGVTTLTFLFQNWSQQHVNSAKTAIIFALEPVFAALFGFLLGNETLSLFAWIGCGLIFIAILITVIKNRD